MYIVTIPVLIFASNCKLFHFIDILSKPLLTNFTEQKEIVKIQIFIQKYPFVVDLSSLLYSLYPYDKTSVRQYFKVNQLILTKVMH